MGKEIIKGLVVVCSVFLAGLFYKEWGTFEYTVPDERPVLFHSDGTPIR